MGMMLHRTLMELAEAEKVVPPVEVPEEVVEPSAEPVKKPERAAKTPAKRTGRPVKKAK